MDFIVIVKNMRTAKAALKPVQAHIFLQSLKPQLFFRNYSADLSVYNYEKRYNI